MYLIAGAMENGDLSRIVKFAFDETAVFCQVKAKNYAYVVGHVGSSVVWKSRFIWLVVYWLQ
jgi:hypothetical protein